MKIRRAQLLRHGLLNLTFSVRPCRRILRRAVSGLRASLHRPVLRGLLILWFAKVRRRIGNRLHLLSRQRRAINPEPGNLATKMVCRNIQQRRRRHLQNRRNAALRQLARGHFAAIGVEHQMIAITNRNRQVPFCRVERLIAGHKSRGTLRLSQPQSQAIVRNGDKSRILRRRIAHACKQSRALNRNLRLEPERKRPHSTSRQHGILYRRLS